MIPSAPRTFPVVPAILFALLAANASGQAQEKRSPRPAWSTSRIQGSPTPPEPYRIAPAFPGLKFANPSSLEEMPGDRMLVTEIGGRIYTFPKRDDVQKADLAGDLVQMHTGQPANPAVRTLFHATLHPEFARNRFLFACYIHRGEKPHTRVSRFKVTEDAPPRLNPNSERVVITWPTGGHNGGCLQFGKDGMLYISTGDGSGPNPPDGLTTGQDVSDLLGSILRIDVNDSSIDRPYKIPEDNPFVDRPEARGEIWAYGLRNPWKFGIDGETGAIFAADNGWETWEMVHRIERGGNCGWPIMEGRAILRSEVPLGPTPIRPPVKDHPHTEANSVIGGPIYRGKKLPGLEGAFIYGDYITGTIWAVSTEGSENLEHQTLVDTDQRIVAFTEGRQGELYVLDYDFTGQIYEVLPNNRKDTSADFPRRLSETGLFKSLETLVPAPGVVPFDVQVDRWMDGATARRFVAIPNRETIEFPASETEPVRYPEGTVFVKHLSFDLGEGKPRLSVETQILHYEAGRWSPYSYLWNEQGTDADLVDALGADRVLTLPVPHPYSKASPRTWHVNAQNECKLCHNAGAGYVLGFTRNQLETQLGGDVGMGQLDALADRGVIASAAPAGSDASSRLVNPHDETQSLDDRARSYLHANCSMCHHPGGNAIVSFYLRRELPFEKLNTNKGTGIGTFGMQDAKIIVPGDPYRSVLMYRMAKLGYARMPYIGSRVVDSAGVALIEDWIRAMPPLPGQTLSAPLSKGNNTFFALESLKELKEGEKAGTALGYLLPSTEGMLALAGQMHRGGLNEDVFKVTASIGKSPKVAADVRGLFETFVPEAERRPTLGPDIRPETILDVAGNADRGQLIFFSDSARCRNCHDLSSREASVGPTLLEIKKKYPLRSELLQHVLQPSLKIEEEFISYIVLTTSGRVHTGLLIKQDEKQVVLKTAEKKTVTIPRDEIEEMRKAEQSLMPDRILSDLTAQEAADLLSYLMSLEASR